MTDAKDGIKFNDSSLKEDDVEKLYKILGISPDELYKNYFCSKEDKHLAWKPLAV